ncbi:glycosyltransferase family 2 protein [Rheinheimera faecalis]|jgi:teichuronic acid biosynthesis glycosyltransferase TuaG
MDKVSIVLPVYNAKKFVDETIQSVLNQTYTDWELIIVDDCSPDGTFIYLQDKYKDYSNIKIFKNEVNSGAGVTRNRALKEASAKKIAFLDADDIWLPTKLEKQLGHMALNGSAISHTSYAFIDDAGNRIAGRMSVSHHVDLKSYMRNTEIGMSTSLVDRALVGNIEFNPMRTRQDTKLWLTLLGQGFLSNGIDDVLVYYRVRSGQISGNKFKIAWRTFKLYWTVDSIPWYLRVTNFIYYAFNGVIKRLNK